MFEFVSRMIPLTGNVGMKMRLVELKKKKQKNLLEERLRDQLQRLNKRKNVGCRLSGTVDISIERN